MPSTNNRKESSSALKRMEEKYIHCDDRANPLHMYIPVKKLTEQMRELMVGKNYFRLLTQIDEFKFTVLQFYIYCEADMWMCGDSLVFNQNPDKKIWSRIMCSATKAPCVCAEDNKEFLSVCPECKNVSVMIKNTKFKCKNCGFYIPFGMVNKMPWVNISCNLCPVSIGWEKTQKVKEVIFENLIPRVKSEDNETSIKELFKDFIKQLGSLK